MISLPSPNAACGNFSFMAQNSRFGLSVRVLAVLALSPETMQTSASIAESLHASPVMIRRIFSALNKAGFIVQRKGPQGGAQLRMQAKTIGLGDIYAAVSADWPAFGEKAVDAALKRVREDALAAMNETTLATLAKKIKKESAKGASSARAAKQHGIPDTHATVQQDQL